MKKCINCFKTKPLTEFYPKIKGSDKYYQSWCKDCNAEVKRGYKARKRSLSRKISDINRDIVEIAKNQRGPKNR